MDTDICSLVDWEGKYITYYILGNVYLSRYSKHLLYHVSTAAGSLKLLCPAFSLKEGQVAFAELTSNFNIPATINKLNALNVQGCKKNDYTKQQS